MEHHPWFAGHMGQIIQSPSRSILHISSSSSQGANFAARHLFSKEILSKATKKFWTPNVTYIKLLEGMYSCHWHSCLLIVQIYCWKLIALQVSRSRELEITSQFNDIFIFFIFLIFCGALFLIRSYISFCVNFMQCREISAQKGKKVIHLTVCDVSPQYIYTLKHLAAW